MLDERATRFIRPVVQALAVQLHRVGLKAVHITLIGFGLGLFAAVCIATSHFYLALAVMLLSRLCDALDGAVARLSGPTDSGGFLDITLDFLYYAAIPLAFAVQNPAQNALPAAVLLASFMGTGSSFLAFAALAEKRGIRNELASQITPKKSFYFLSGLTESTETLIVFTAMCLWQDYFALLAYGFAVLCGITIFTRIFSGYKQLNQK